MARAGPRGLLEGLLGSQRELREADETGGGGEVSHAAELDDGAKLPEPPSPGGFFGALLTLLRWIDEAVVRLSMIALLVASVVLTYSAVVRYFFKVPTDWQDEMAVFLLIGVALMCGCHWQSVREHVAIQG